MEYASFLRDDGLFEIEGRLVDTTATSGRDLHVMRVRVIFDQDLIIHAAESTLETAPFPDCSRDDLFPLLVGEQLSPGWKQRVAKKLRRRESCVHQMELLFSLATVAYQAISVAPEVDGRDPFEYLRSKGVRPYFLNGCRAWQTDGDLVRQVFPTFAEPRRD